MNDAHPSGFVPESIQPIEYSIVIPAFRRAEMLERCLECLSPGSQSGAFMANEPNPDPAQSRITYEVIVSDDSPDPRDLEAVRARFPWVRWVKGPQRGPASNRNEGARHASGRWLVFTDDDCLPSSEWLLAFSRVESGQPLLEGKTIADRPRSRLDEEAPINETGGYLWSCNFAILRTCFEDQSGFDEGFPYPAMEDVEFRVRLAEAGINPKFCPEAVVIHPWRRTKGITHRKRELASWYHFLKLHPDKRPHSLSLHFFHRSFRTLIKVTIPGTFRYSFRGCLPALKENAFFAIKALKALMGYDEP